MNFDEAHVNVAQVGPAVGDATCSQGFQLSAPYAGAVIIKGEGEFPIGTGLEKPGGPGKTGPPGPHKCQILGGPEGTRKNTKNEHF